MKSAPFTYHRPSTLDEALALKRELGGDARILAGGQSLMPLMHFRLASPGHLIDINRIDELGRLGRSNGHLAIGAVVRQQQVLTSPEAAAAAPLLVDAVGWVGHDQIRHRGTVAGSIAHADPSAEIPAVALALGASMVARSATGERVIPAVDFFTGPFSTALADDEILTEVRIPAIHDGAGTAWMEFSRIYHGFPVVGVGAVVRMSDDVVESASVAMCGMAGSAVLATVGSLIGQEPTAAAIAAAADESVTGLDPPGDIHGSGPYRIRVGRAYVGRALAAAVRATRGGAVR